MDPAASSCLLAINVLRAGWQWVRLAALWACLMGAAHALDINHANEAELDSVRGLGPTISRAILAERQIKPFANWADLMRRVKGIGPASAERFAAQGLTVNGQGLPASASTKP